MQAFVVVIALIVLVAVVPVVAADPPVNAVEKEKKLLQGTWKGVSLDGPDGKPVPDVAEKARLVVDGDTWTIINGDTKTENTFVIDPTKSPKTLDVITEKDGKKVVVQALYELDGDTLKVCRPAPPPKTEPRPEKFAAGNGNAVMTLKREKK